VWLPSAPFSAERSFRPMLLHCYCNSDSDSSDGDRDATANYLDDYPAEVDGGGTPQNGPKFEISLPADICYLTGIKTDVCQVPPSCTYLGLFIYFLQFLVLLPLLSYHIRTFNSLHRLLSKLLGHPKKLNQRKHSDSGANGNLY
jgi:hypothetical protein